MKTGLWNVVCKTYVCLSYPLRTSAYPLFSLPVGRNRVLIVQGFQFELSIEVWTTSCKDCKLFHCHGHSKFSNELSVHYTMVRNSLIEQISFQPKPCLVPSRMIIKRARVRSTKSAHSHSTGKSPKRSECIDRIRQTCLSALLRTFISYVPWININVTKKQRKMNLGESHCWKEERNLLYTE